MEKDTITPFSALEENSFARFTIDKRLPQIFKDHCNEDYFECISKTSVEKGLINCDAHLIEKLLPQLELYKNESIKSFFYTAPFLLVEFYFYHMLLSLNNYNENHFDFFAQKKRESVRTYHKKFLAILENLFDTKSMKTKEMLHSTLRYALFSNTEDLSQLNREKNVGVQLLCDDTSHVYNFLQKKETAYKQFDIICDNAGAELFSDLYMACYFILTGYTEQVVLHLKNVPFFVSDATQQDFSDLLELLKEKKYLYDSVKTLLQDNKLVINANELSWVNCLNFCDLPKPVLANLNKSDLVIFKGDLNYRRLIEDRMWDVSTSMTDLTKYFTTNLLILRVLKSEALVGISSNKVKSTAQNDPDFKVNGKWGIITMEEKN